MLQLFAHPFSSYCQKVLIALYENATPFAWRVIAPDDPATGAEFAALWPLAKMPMLFDDGHVVVEASIIIEYLDTHYPGAAPLVPATPEAALRVRMLDRVFDNYVMTPMQAIVSDYIRAPADRDPLTVVQARALLDRTYAWLDRELSGRVWAAGDVFTLADCAAGPALFYADWVHPIPPACEALAAYRARLLARPSFARAIEEARPYRGYFPPGAPDRD